MSEWSKQRYWEEVEEGEYLSEGSFPLTLHRLVVAAGANKDFTSIHHNTEWARSKGAPEAFANSSFLQGMWERVVREFIGLDGVIRKIGPFRMKTFTPVGETVRVRGRVERKWRDGADFFVELHMSSVISSGESVSGSVLVTLPSIELETGE